MSVRLAVVLAAIVLGLLAGEARAQVCATLTTTVQGQAPIQEGLRLAGGVALAGMIELLGTGSSNGDLIRGGVALLPGGATARLGLTITDAPLQNVRFVGLLFTLATASGTGVFSRLDGVNGTAAIQLEPCP
jgi:hypothetical protein